MKPNLPVRRGRRNAATLITLLLLPSLACASTRSNPATSRSPSSSIERLGEDEEEQSADTLDQFITQTMRDSDIPGLAALVIRNDQIVMAKGYGFADIDRKVPVTPDTDFLISSCSKTIGAVTLMQLYDQGKFGLDDDINKYLPSADPDHLSRAADPHLRPRRGLARRQWRRYDEARRSHSLAR
jgi:CubicO group peptidase (beta-lactamase class C family)